MPNSAPEAPRPERRFSTVQFLGVILLLTSATMVVHGWSLADGTVLDDHWHQKGLREHGWSPSELLRTLEIEPAQWVQLWWQNESVRWEYFRPLFILGMKVCYGVIGGNDPVPLHAFSIGLHVVSAVLIVLLARRLGLGRAAALVAGLVFVVYPHAIMTVAWPSSQNVVLLAPLLIGAMLCWLGVIGVGGAKRGTPVRALVGLFVLWLLALLTRENALLLPMFLAALDLGYNGWRGVRGRLGVYAIFAAVGVGFVALRAAVVTHPMPDVYVQWPGADGIVAYAFWAFAKLLHYLTTAVWFAPMTIGPTGRYHPFFEAPFDIALMVGILAAMGALYWWLTRERRGWWLWPLWVLLAVLPVVPVIATPHSGYLAGVGVALGLGVVLDGRSRSAAAWGDGAPLSRHVRRGVIIVYLTTACVFAMFTRWQWTAIIAAEQLVIDNIAAQQPESDVEHVFFINLPFVNIYAKPALDRRLGEPFASTRAHVLTFSPDVFLFEQRSFLRVVDGHTLDVEVRGRPYFAGLLGRFLLEGFSTYGHLASGFLAATEEFDVEVLESEPAGVRALRFRFRRPLSDPAYAFYLTSRVRGAARLRFGAGLGALQESTPSGVESERASLNEVNTLAAQLNAGSASAGARLLAIGSGARLPAAVRSAAREAAMPVVSFVAEATGGPEFASSAADFTAARDWWRARVDDAVLADTWLMRERFAHWYKQREEVPNARMWIGKVLRADLYLTGAPFPGPRPEAE